jgi:hypothetical protein
MSSASMFCESPLLVALRIDTYWAGEHIVALLSTAGVVVGSGTLT